VPTQRHTAVPPQDIPLDIVYEDDSFVVLNKAADMVVHPSKGHATGTLVNALVFHFRNLSSNYGPLRPGVVHRLDRDTTGVILIIKDDRVHAEIALQFERRQTQKEYVCIVEGQPELDGDIVDAPIGHSARDRQRMCVRADGKSAQTRYEVTERLGRFAVVHCFPRSGRTHQIRVHMQYIGNPIVCDKLYGRRHAIFASDLTGAEHLPDELPLIERQALHARRITIRHPVRNAPATFEAPMPPDMLRLIEALRGAVD
jgi:23S rRNA pseudouridine1911/1915/1917 synthase